MYPLKDAHHHLKNKLRSLNCTIFDPNIFLIFSKSIFFHISPTRLNNSIMGNYLDFGLKIAHRGNTGSHRGKRKLICLSKKWICAYLRFFLCFCIWHKANSVFTSPKFPPIFQNKNFDLQLFFFRVNITQHEGNLLLSRALCSTGKSLIRNG